MLNDVARLVSRIALGASIASHGAQKAWGTFGGPGPEGAAQFMESLGFAPGSRFAGAASTTELGSGLLIALGLGGPIGPSALITTMVVAQTTVHAKNGFFAQNGGIELGLVYSTAALALASSGYGRFSLDEALGWDKLREPGLVALTLAGGVAAALVILAQRSGPGAPAPAATSDSALDTASGSDSATSPAFSQPAVDPIATTESHISAAAEDRPVPADLLSSSDESTRLL